MGQGNVWGLLRLSPQQTGLRLEFSPIFVKGRFLQSGVWTSDVGGPGLGTARGGRAPALGYLLGNRGLPFKDVRRGWGGAGREDTA